MKIELVNLSLKNHDSSETKKKRIYQSNQGGGKITKEKRN